MLEQQPWTEGTENKGQNPPDVPPASSRMEGSAFPRILNASIASEVWRFFLNHLFLCDSQEVPAEYQGTWCSFLLSQPASSSARRGINCDTDKLAQPGSGARLFRPAAPSASAHCQGLAAQPACRRRALCSLCVHSRGGRRHPKDTATRVGRGRGGTGTGATGWPRHPEPLRQGFISDGLCSPE